MYQNQNNNQNPYDYTIQPPYQQPYVPHLPSGATTFWVTLFFGLFGLIPAFIHSNRAQQYGQSGARYWKAFWAAVAIYVAIALIAFVVLVVSTNNVINAHNRGAAQVVTSAPETFTDGPAVAPPAITEDSTPNSSSNDALYLSMLDAAGIGSQYGTDEELVYLAGKVCDNFDKGMTFQQIDAVLIAEGFGDADAVMLIGAATGAYCSEDLSKIK